MMLRSVVKGAAKVAQLWGCSESPVPFLLRLCIKGFAWILTNTDTYEMPVSGEGGVQEEGAASLEAKEGSFEVQRCSEGGRERRCT